ncbi:MAG TPA: dihydropteroate synthase [Polyangia bacterium]|nr:dihydropteroate synthase [Polyangia bacterium]
MAQVVPTLTFRRAAFAGERTIVMGVVNVTPDSFSDGGAFSDTAAAIAHGGKLVTDGADIVDVGGESTRPGAAPVPLKEEAARVLPVVRALAGAITVSVDTYKAAIAAAALDAGAEIVNDVSGGALEPDLLRVVADHRATVILGHLRGTPAEMNAHARYDDVMREVMSELGQRIDAAVDAGVAPGRILVDPGIGFAKNGEHNLVLLARLAELKALGCPIVVGASRKSFLGTITGRDAGDREMATAAAHAVAITNGAAMVRVHDVRAQRDAVLVADALRAAAAGKRVLS